MPGRRPWTAAAALLLVGGAGLIGEQVYLAGKARLAGMLIDRAFGAHLRDGDPHRPWRGADLHPVARIEVPRLGVSRTVLSGASGPSLAFGPGHVDGTAPPNGRGNSVIAGHRDSWFAFLEQLRDGDRVRVTTFDGSCDYRVAERRVVSMWDAEVLASAAEPRLTLITCYPFGGLTRSPWRYVVLCEPVERRVGGLRAGTGPSVGRLSSGRDASLPGAG